MATMAARYFTASFLKTAIVVLSLSLLPLNLAEARSNTSNSKSQSKSSVTVSSILNFLKNSFQSLTKPNDHSKQSAKDDSKRQPKSVVLSHSKDHPDKTPVQTTANKNQSPHKHFKTNAPQKHSKNYSKHYDGSHLKAWLDYIRRWHHHRKPAHAHDHHNPPVPPDTCPVDFQKKVSAVKVKGHHIYFNLNDLAFLKSAGFSLKEAELELVLKGHHQSQENISISLNGLKVTYPGHTRLNNVIEYFKFHDMSRTKFSLHHLFLNGAEPFAKYLARIKKHQGLLKISLYGRHYTIVSASATFKGIAYTPCDNPGPNPDPDPVPPEDLSKYEVRIDSTDPATNRTSSTSMVIHFSSINTDGTYWCSLDQASFEKCQSPVSYAALANGSHNFEVFATTPKGADGAKASYSWSVDNSRPVVTITNAAQLPTLTNEASMSFEFASSKPNSSFKCSLDEGAFSSCQSPMAYNVTTEGLHKFSVTATDALGNASGNPATFQWTLDQTGPVTSLTSVLPDEDYSSDNAKAFTFSANETSDFECALDQTAYTACDSPLALSALSEGPHVFSIQATDMAGNKGAAISYSWTTDYTLPQISMKAVTPTSSLTNSQALAVEITASEPGTLYCQLDTATAVECVSPYTRDALSEGPHQLIVYAIDRAGLKSENVTLSWTVDLTAPMISFGAILPSSASFINSTSLNVEVNASEDSTLSATLNGASITLGGNMISLSGLMEGDYTLTVTGSDSAGNTSNTITHSFTVDLTSPVLTLVTEGQALSNQDFRSFNFSANETVDFQCSLDDAGFAPCQDQASYSGLADGDHTFTLRGTDKAGNVSTATSSWTQDATAPNTSQSNFINGNSITINLSSTEANVSYLCSLDGVPISPCNSSITYDNLAVGEHLFLARSVDAAGNIDPVGASFTFIIAAPIKTIITGGNPPDDIVRVNTMTISFTADQPAQGFICSLDGADFTSCVSAVTYTNLEEGSHTVVIKAIDQFGEMDPVGATKTWTVDTTAPTVTSFTTSSTTNSITVTWTTSEPATGRVNYGVGSALNQNSAEITTPQTTHSIKLIGLSSNTVYSIRVLGKDAAGNTYISNTVTARTNR